ncbi:MAG: flagellin FliC [Bdellovibrionales bacterium]|nr:flagellin FliC [Bdellovibrionales bacterium]
MSFRVNCNVIPTLTAQRFLAKAQRDTAKSLIALSSGSRVTLAGDDAAGFAISESLRGQLSGLKQAKSNTGSAISLIQTAEGGLSEQNNILVRLRELAVYAASDTVGEEERGFLDHEFQQLVAEFDRIAKSTRYGNKFLLTGTGEKFEFQVGPYKDSENRIHFSLDADSTSSAVGIDGLAVDDKGNALDALESLDEALTKVAGNRTAFGAMQSRLQFTADTLGVQAENIEAARSQIADTDVAEAVSILAKNQIQQEAAVSVLAQANNDHQRLLRLIG